MAAAEVAPSSKSILKLAVLGATGPTGMEAVKKSLELGHHVTAIVRSPDKLNNIKNENLDVVKANIFEPESLVPHLQGKDAVLSYLGAHGTTVFNPTTLYSESMKSIMTAMERSNVNRIVTLTSWITEYPNNTPIKVKLVRPIMLLGGFMKDMRRMEKILEESSFNYTIIRPPGLSNASAKKNYKLVEAAQFVDGAGMFIPRADVADASLKVLLTPEWDKKAVAIGCD
ncbi:uncharacterized protein At2g34460, chloroplastic [Exaiptasia diaphana]|uniref:NAD(P)-binding domain-containing protein n=1 Tax=Exaiptasia diaphana TaxID=2652724 RepID=A0A913WSU4_EXADI|nr:uncharacterized protein At2g34460, chloroplastic [Exaiptasia diaphana]KXJ18180.1 Flavin reductase (NADPH) [Exaiptasia diaphana]